MTDISEQDVRERTQTLIAEVGADAGQVEFRSAQWDAGLAMVQYPEGKGGLGVVAQVPGRRCTQELRAAGVTYESMAINPIGIGMGLPTVLTYGSGRHARSAI